MIACTVAPKTIVTATTATASYSSSGLMMMMDCTALDLLSSLPLVEELGQKEAAKPPLGDTNR